MTERLVGSGRILVLLLLALVAPPGRAPTLVPWACGGNGCASVVAAVFPR